ncbi:hypothetical protein H4Q26_007836 [Puccinia striiformis f. sp. tritici PST-130]|nr:hypothetical protein H4Q26_007836 [Puccinia striiformis f. sp. tritici PST-130]
MPSTNRFLDLQSASQPDTSSEVYANNNQEHIQQAYFRQVKIGMASYSFLDKAVYALSTPIVPYPQAAHNRISFTHTLSDNPAFPNLVHIFLKPTTPHHFPGPLTSSSSPSLFQGLIHSSINMVFTDPSTRIRTRIKTESIPPVPLPVLHLPETLSSDFNESKVFDDFWDMKSTAPVLLKRSDKKLSKIRPSERQKTQAKPPPMDSVLYPIHLTSLLAESSQSLLSTTTRATRRRSSSDSVYSSSLICLPSAGPFTPELVINHVGKTTPEFSADYFVHTEQKSCLPVVTSTDPSDSPQSIDSAKIAWVNNSPNPSLRAVKLSASTSHRCLKRRGLIPSNQPITSQLLQSVMSTSTSDLGCHTETKDSSPAFKLQPALSAEISVWTDDSDKRSTLRPKNPITRQPLATIDQNLSLPMPSYGRKTGQANIKSC